MSPSNALIYRDGVIVEGLDAFTNGLSQVNDAAIYQVNYKLGQIISLKT